MKKKENLFKVIDPIVFLPACFIMLACIFLGLINKELLLQILLNVHTWASENFGWPYVIVTILSLFVLLLLLFHPVGKKKLGGEDAEPEISTFAWFCITLTSTIGIALIFWGSVEPVQHFTNPPAFAGVKANSEQAAVFALSTGYIHWSFNQYALYTIAGVAIAFAHFNHKQPMSVAGGMYFAIGKNRFLGKIADALCLIVIVGAVASSLGIGIKQIVMGINYIVSGLSSSVLIPLVTFIIILTYSLASVSGVKKGIAIISKLNVWIFFGLLLFVYVFGPTQFINKLGTQSIGNFIATGLERSMITSPIADDSWINNWTLNFFVGNAAYAPLIGLFLAKIARGRTIRSFVGMNLMVCSIFNIVWFNVFGSAAIYAQIHGLDIAAIMAAQGLESAAFAFFSSLPLAKIIVPIFTIAIFFSFVTMAQSLVTSMSIISLKGGYCCNADTENKPLILFWGIVVGAIAYILLDLVGTDVMKYMYLVFGFPIFIILFAMMYSVLKGLFFPEFELIRSINNFFKER